MYSVSGDETVYETAKSQILNSNCKRIEQLWVPHDCHTLLHLLFEISRLKEIFTMNRFFLLLICTIFLVPSNAQNLILEKENGKRKYVDIDRVVSITINDSSSFRWLEITEMTDTSFVLVDVIEEFDTNFYKVYYDDITSISWCRKISPFRCRWALGPGAGPGCIQFSLILLVSSVAAFIDKNPQAGLKLLAGSFGLYGLLGAYLTTVFGSKEIGEKWRIIPPD